MTKKARAILFLSLLILFLITAPITILYCLGWRFDWEAKKIIQPGVFYFKTWPKNSQIYLNAELKKKTDLFFGSALIENLSPKEYVVEIRKQGFHEWKKTLGIKKRQVTEAKNIILIPENPDFTIISERVESCYFSPDNKKIILNEKANTTTSENSGWALKLFDLEKKVKSLLIKEKDISPGQQSQLIDLKFSPDSKRILLELGIISTPDVSLGASGANSSTSGVKIYYLLEIDRAPVALTRLDFLGPGVSKIYFIPKNPQKLLISKAGGLSEVDLINKKISPPVLENIVTFLIYQRDIYYLEEPGFLFKTDFSFDRKEKLNTIPFSLGPETEYKIFGINSHIFLKQGNILYFLNKDKKSFEKLFEPVKNLRFSPDSKKLVYFNNYEIWVLFLEQIYDQPQRQVGEKVFLSRFSEKIDEVFWYTSHYLVLNVGDRIKITETDDRDKINIVDFAEFSSSEQGKSPEIFWNQNNKKLYILSEEILYSSKKLTP